MMNANLMRFECWLTDAITLDEAKADMEENVRDAVEEMQEMAFWRIFPDLKGKYDKTKTIHFDALALTKDWLFGKDTVADVDWKKLEIESYEQLYIWLKAKSWQVISKCQ